MGRGLGTEPSDGDILRLLARDEERAWSLLLDRYGARLLGYFKALGYDRDQAMDRFVALCDRLRQDRFRRLREIDRLGDRGELVPWLLQTAKRVAIDRTVAELGKRRLPKAVESMSAFDQRVFGLYFWQGLKPSELGEELGRDENRRIEPTEVFEALERILERLSSPRIWRLIAQRSRQVAPVALVDSDLGAAAAPAQDGEAKLLHRERSGAVARLLERLPMSDRVLLRLRYGEGLGIEDVARQVGLEAEEVRLALRRARRKARRLLETEESGLRRTEVAS